MSEGGRLSGVIGLGRGSGELSGWIDFYPMVAHGGVDYLTCRLRDDHIGFLDRHVAIDAFVCNFVTQLPGHAAALPGVTGKALLRIERGGLPCRVDIVARGAGHFVG